MILFIITALLDAETASIASIVSEAAGRDAQVEYVAKSEGKMAGYFTIVIHPDEAT